MELTVLSGGTGTPKLLAGFRDWNGYQNGDLNIIANTGDDVEISGNLVCPDLDSVLYTMAGMIDEDTWFGIAGDSLNTHETVIQLSETEPEDPYLPRNRQTEGGALSQWRRFSGYHEFMSIGDRDRATHITRSALLSEGANLARATELIGDSLGIEANVIPMTNDPVATIVHTEDGEMHFQEFWLGRGGEPAVTAVEFRGRNNAQLPGVTMDALQSPVVIGPSNPVTSVGPILALKGVEQALQKVPVVAVSPFVGDEVFSGPAGELMEAEGYQPSTAGVAKRYGCFLDLMILDQEDDTELDVSTVRADTNMSDPDTRKDLAKLVCDTMKQLSN